MTEKNKRSSGDKGARGRQGLMGTASTRLLVGRVGAYLLFVLLLLSGTEVPAQENAPFSNPTEQMCTVAYSREFAQRFGLPEPRPGWETQPPLHGIEFVVEPAPPWAKGHYCAYKLYLDSSLPLAYGNEGPTGDFRPYVAAQHFFVRDPDNPKAKSARSVLFDKVSGYGGMAVVATPDYVYEKKGAATDAGVGQEEYVRELLPGITYLKLGGSCGMMSYERRANTMQLWLKKAGGKDYRKVVQWDPDDFIKLPPLPAGFYRQTLPWREEIGKEQSKIVKEMDRELRERTMKRKGKTQQN